MSTFKVHILNQQGIKHAQWMQAAFEDFLANLEAVAGPDGREMAICRTKLEEASFFAKKAMAMRLENQEAA